MAEEISSDDLAMFRIMEEKLHDPAVRRSARLTGELLADDFVEFGSSGSVYGRAEIIEALGREVHHAATPILAFDYELKRLSDDVALLTYRTTSSAGQSMRSSIWRRKAGRWQMIFHQGTRAAGG